MKKALLITLNILIGLLFLYSGYAKLRPIFPLETSLVDFGVSNWFLTPFLARFLVAAEFVCGLLLIFHLYLKKWTYPAVLFFLSIFIVYLLLLIYKYGNTGNCGCFGTKIVMSPLEGIGKNIVLIILVSILYKFHRVEWKLNGIMEAVLGLVFIGAICLPFGLNPMSTTERAFIQFAQMENINIDSLYTGKYSEVPKVEIRKGKQIVAFMSLWCEHCRLVAQRLSTFKRQNPALPIYFVFKAGSGNLQEFMNETKAFNIPYTIYEAKGFNDAAGVAVPRVFLCEDGKAEAVSIKYYSIRKEYLEQWLAKR